MAAGGGDYKEHLHALALYDKNVPIRRRLFMTATPKVAMVKQASDDAKEEGESLALSMGEEEVYGSEHVEQCDESGRRDIVRGRKYSMRFDQAITRGLITDYKLLVISVDGKREEIESLANATLSTEDGSPFAAELAAWKERVLERRKKKKKKSDPKDSQKELEPEVEALEVAKVKALEDAFVHQGLQKVFVFSSLKQCAR